MDKRIRGKDGEEWRDWSAPNAEYNVRLHPERLEAPLHWRKPRRVFVNSMSDLFHEQVPDGFIVRVLMTMLRTPQHEYQILTKRPERMRDFFTRWADLSGESWEPKLVRGPDATRETHPSGRGQLFASYLESLASETGGEPPPGAAWPTFDWMEGPRWWPTLPPFNVWLGVSVEDQRRADERIPLLLETPAAVRFLSCEPLLGPVDLTALQTTSGPASVVLNALSGAQTDRQYPNWRPRPDAPSTIDWVIVGGESGPGARPCDLAWVRGIVGQCQAAGVAVFVKQLGSAPGYPLFDGKRGGIGEALSTGRPLEWKFQSPDGSTFRRDGDGNRVAHYMGLRDRKGGDMGEWPADLRVREFPAEATDA